MKSLKIYDYLLLARRRVFDWVRPLSAEQYAHEFPFAHKTLARTLTHIMICEWYYMQRIQARAVPPYAEWQFQDETPPPFAVLEPAWTEEAGRTRAALGAVRDWDAELSYQMDDGGPAIVTASPADIFAQLVLHEVHHRAQAMVMLRHFGVTLADVDYNAFMYKRRATSP